MKAMIHINTLNEQKSASGKAIYLTVGLDRTGYNTKHVWFPLSQLKISEPNSCGWCSMEFPFWLLKNNRITRACYFEELESVEY